MLQVWLCSLNWFRTLITFCFFNRQKFGWAERSQAAGKHRLLDPWMLYINTCLSRCLLRSLRDSDLKEKGPLTVGRIQPWDLVPVKLKQERVSRSIRWFPSHFLCVRVSVWALSVFVWPRGGTGSRHSHICLWNFCNILHKLVKMKQKIALKLINADTWRSV